MLVALRETTVQVTVYWERHLGSLGVSFKSREFCEGF